MNRRNFRRLKVAVVGGGAFGEVHLRTFHSMPQIEVGGIYTLESARGAHLCRTYGGRNYESLQALAEDPSIDLVSIATPEMHHLEPFQVLAAHGKAIYVEKPLATSLVEARKILDLAASITAMSGHCLRFDHRLVQIFERLRGVPKHHLSFRQRRIRQEKTIYGRVHPAYALLCHEIELSNAFSESSFHRLVAMETRFSSGQVDGLTILIEYENGVTSLVEGGWLLPDQTSCQETDAVSIVSAAGTDELSMPHLGNFYLDHEGMKIPNLSYGHSVYGLEYGPLRAAFDYMVRCILDREVPNISTIQDAYNTVELIDAALRSVAENRWVTRNERPHGRGQPVALL